MANAFQPGAFQTSAYQTSASQTANAMFGAIAGLAPTTRTVRHAATSLGVAGSISSSVEGTHDAAAPAFGTRAGFSSPGNATEHAAIATFGTHAGMSSPGNLIAPMHATLGVTAGYSVAALPITAVASGVFSTKAGFTPTEALLARYVSLTIAVIAAAKPGLYGPAFQSSAFQSSAFQLLTGGYIAGSIRVADHALAPAFGAKAGEGVAGSIPLHGISNINAMAALSSQAAGVVTTASSGHFGTRPGLTASAVVQLAPIVTTSGRLYKPPTRVVTREQPYLSLVTQVDPSWSHRKFREVQYEFQNRRILFNPYVGGAYNNYDNTYPVGAQYGSADPSQLPLTAANIGAVAVTGQQVVELPRPAAASAGALVIVVVVDGSAPGSIPAGAFSDGANEYQILLSARTNSGQTLAVAYAILPQAIPKNALISYVSPNTIGVTTAIAMAGIIVTGGVQPTVFDPLVTASLFGSGQTPTVTSGEPQQGGELFVGICAAALEGTFTPDGLHGWMAPQQAGTGGSTPLCLCTSVQNGPNFDPGISASVIFSPALSGIAAWSTLVLGVRGNKPAYSGVETGGWA